MVKVLAYLVGFVGILTLCFGVGLLLAFPVKWFVNYVFSQAFILYVFGVTQLTFWKAYFLSILTSWLFKTSVSSSS